MVISYSVSSGLSNAYIDDVQGKRKMKLILLSA